MLSTDPTSEYVEYGHSGLRKCLHTLEFCRFSVRRRSEKSR